MGVDIQVNFGKFQVSIDMRDFTVKIHPFKDNIMIMDAYYHTYVSSDGYPCFGNMDEQAYAASRDCRIYELMNIVQALLTTYTEHNPYASLSRFAQGLDHPTESQRRTTEEAKEQEQEKLAISDDDLKIIIKNKLLTWFGNESFNKDEAQIQLTSVAAKSIAPEHNRDIYDDEEEEYYDHDEDEENYED
jgi:hypothetical protein